MLSAHRTMPVERREFLRIGGLVAGGLGLSEIAAARSTNSRTDTSVILIFCWGGPSHLETYDLKPDGPAEMRSVFKPIATTVAGLSICEHLPLHAKIAHQFSVIRSMSHKINIHNDGSIAVLTGKEPSVPDPTSMATSEHPDIGMIAAKMRGPHRDAIPPYVSIPTPLHMTRPTYLGPAYQPFTTGDVSSPGYRPPLLALRGQNVNTLNDRKQLLRQLDHARRELSQSAMQSGMDPFRSQAYDILTSPAVAQAFDLQRESERLRDRYGRHLWGQACLMARRLAEAGTAVVTMIANTPENGPKFTNWDDHPGNAMRPGHFAEYMKVRLPYFDQSVSALIEDIHSRGLDRKIMVVVMGEFGRTPRIRTGPPDNSIGRDHWPDAYSVLISGGGLRMGQVIGATNARGEYPTTAPTSPNDVLATMYQHLGIDPTHHFKDTVGKPTPILYTGTPVRGL